MLGVLALQILQAWRQPVVFGFDVLDRDPDDGNPDAAHRVAQSLEPWFPVHHCLHYDCLDHWHLRLPSPLAVYGYAQAHAQVMRSTMMVALALPTDESDKISPDPAPN